MTHQDKYELAVKWLEIMHSVRVAPDVVTYSTLINLSPDLATAERWLQEMRDAGVRPNEVTYNTLINLSPDLATAERWLQEMRDAGVRPDEVTYSTLINLSPDLATAERWLQEMRDAGVRPNEFTYSTLINLSPDLATAERWLQEMGATSLKPRDETLSALMKKATTFDDGCELCDRLATQRIFVSQSALRNLFSKDLSDKTAQTIFAWYFLRQYHPGEPLGAAINSFRRSKLIDEALRISLAYPHLDAARRLMRDIPDRALEFFRSTVESDSNNGNGYYAIAICLIELGRKQEARPYLDSAEALSTAVKRKEHIRSLRASL